MKGPGFPSGYGAGRYRSDGGTLLIRSWWPLLVLPSILVVIRRTVIDREELYLTERFGDTYRDYQLRVRRWL